MEDTTTCAMMVAHFAPDSKLNEAQLERIWSARTNVITTAFSLFGDNSEQPYMGNLSKCMRSNSSAFVNHLDAIFAVTTAVTVAYIPTCLRWFCWECRQKDIDAITRSNRANGVRRRERKALLAMAAMRMRSSTLSG